MLTKTADNILSKMTVKFNHNNCTYFTNGFVAFRHFGVLDEYKHLEDNENSVVMIRLFDDPMNRYDYRLAENQPTISSIVGKDKFLFGYMKQLVSVSFIRMAWKIMGRTARFYLSCSRIYPVLVKADNDWEMVIMPINYKPDDYPEDYEVQ